MTSALTRLAVPTADGTNAAGHALRLGSYLPAETGTLPSAFARASGNAGEATSDGIFLKTTGSLEVVAKGLGGTGGVLGLSADTTVAVTSGDLAVTVDGLFSAAANGIRLRATSDVTTAADADPPGGGTVDMKADSEIKMTAPTVIFEAPSVKTSEKTQFFKEKNGWNKLQIGYDWGVFLGISNSISAVMSSTLCFLYVKMGGVDTKMGYTDSKAILIKCDICRYKVDNKGILTGLIQLLWADKKYLLKNKVADIDKPDVQRQIGDARNNMRIAYARQLTMMKIKQRGARNEM